MNIAWVACDHITFTEGIRFISGYKDHVFEADKLVDVIQDFGVDRTVVWLAQEIEDKVPGVDFADATEAAANGIVMLADHRPEIRGLFP